MRFFIIGGTRFIGPHVVTQLTEQNHEVTVFHRGQSKAGLPESVQTINGHRDNLFDFTKQIDTFKPDVVLDMIPVFERHGETLMSTFKNRTNRVVIISSCDVYRAYGIFHGKETGHEPVPLTEDSPVREVLYPYRTDPPRTKNDPMAWADHYDKIPIERRVLNDPDLPGTVLRLPAVYGPNDNQHRQFPLLKRMQDNRPFILLEQTRANWRFCRGYVENVAAGIVCALTRETSAGKIYNIAEEYTHTETEWAQKVADVYGWSGDILSLPKDQMPEHLLDDGNWTQDLATDSTRIRTELGYSEIIPLNEGLQRTVAWENKNPPPQIDESQFNYAAEDKVSKALQNED